ncbi:YihY/virulence factor BrkB family protein [Falsiroseomonas bella]|uniref:YihY/virulence factor BrkB family protein n=1 Tax=Falsiroseomonas bella TaxID=2184016 RepID=A0A317FAM8_9PROT|nr:YihY/virulence factor BrkB family protein [Falsiroseomonas bella]
MPRTPRPSTPWAILAGAFVGWLVAGGERQPAAAGVPAVANRRNRRMQRAGGDAGSGRDAAAPQDIPSRGWWAILKRTVREAGNDRLMTEAAGITFYTLLALFPAIAALVSLYGLVADPETVAQHIDALAGVVPGGGMQIIQEQVNRVTSQPQGTLGFGVAAGLLISLWSANAATKAVVDSLNVVYEEEEKRGFLTRTAVTLALTLGALLFAILAMAAVLVLPAVLTFVGLGGTAEWILRIGRWPLLAVAVALLLAILYRFGPSRETPRWQWVSWGSGVAAVLWLLVSIAFSWYVANFGSYNETYGSLGAVIGFMTWIWISAMVVLFGGELNAEMEHQTARDTTTGPPRPLGARGAEMADRVASG